MALQLWFNLFSMLFSSYLSHALLDFSGTCYNISFTLYIIYNSSNLHITIPTLSYFRGHFIWLGKRFHNSYLSHHLILKFIGKTNVLMYTMTYTTVLFKTILLVMSYVEVLEFDFKWFVNYITALNQA